MDVLNCKNCEKSCCERSTVFLTLRDFREIFNVFRDINMENLIGEALTLYEIKKGEFSNIIFPKIRIKNKYFLLGLRKTEKGCYFYNDLLNTCQNYEHRHRSCRLYPYEIINNKVEFVLNYQCKDVPIPDDEELLELNDETNRFNKDLQEYTNNIKEWNESKRPSNEFYIFLLEKIQQTYNI